MWLSVGTPRKVALGNRVKLQLAKRTVGTEVSREATTHTNVVVTFATVRAVDVTLVAMSTHFSAARHRLALAVRLVHVGRGGIVSRGTPSELTTWSEKLRFLRFTRA